MVRLFAGLVVGFVVGFVVFLYWTVRVGLHQAGPVG